MDIPHKEIDGLWRKIAKLNELLWEGKAYKSNIDSWLNNFSSQDEKDHALYLLSKFIYFGEIFVRELTRSIYRDLFRYPLIKKIREENYDTTDENFIEDEFKKTQDKTLILPMGVNSDSGGYLLYLFRQEGDHPVSLFNETNDPSTYERVILIDDFCGSGTQGTSDDVKNRVKSLRKRYPNAKICFYLLMGTFDGLCNIRSFKLFDEVQVVMELDASFKCFSLNSRIFGKNTPFDKQESRDMCERYGTKLFTADEALGFGKCELLLGFHHNTPDNTLPIIWCEKGNIHWIPIFKRHIKNYG